MTVTLKYSFPLHGLHFPKLKSLGSSSYYFLRTLSNAATLNEVLSKRGMNS